MISRWFSKEPSPYAEAEALYRKYHPMMRRRCRRILRDEVLVDDAMQESFWALCRGLHRFQGNDAQLISWLYRVTTTHCLKLLERERRWDRVVEAVFDEGTMTVSGGSVESQLVVQEVLSKLPPLQQEAVLYWLLNGMTQEEIAEVMGTTRHQVRQWLSSFSQKAKVWMGLEEVDG
ncbi:MAG: sigma-70 family RNA polymerase sigma factor [Myxococcales bacterium]|nr:sigma-70 family RNA polymerase sigma factor [Myxococcales bacterium]